MKRSLAWAFAAALTTGMAGTSYAEPVRTGYSLGAAGKPKSKDTKAKRKMRKASQRKNRK